MRDAKEWAKASFCLPEHLNDTTDLIRVIQRDAYRAGLEAAANRLAELYHETTDDFDARCFAQGADVVRALIEKEAQAP